MFYSLNSLPLLSNARSRSISAENVYGEPGRGGMADVSVAPQPEVLKIGQPWAAHYPPARDLGRKWKVRPCITLPPGETVTLADIEGPGCIRHIWLTTEWLRYREVILRFYGS